MTISKFDRNQAQAFIKELEVVAKALAAKHGVRFTPGRATFDEVRVTMKVEFQTVAQTVVPGSGTSAAPSVSNILVQACNRFGLNPHRVAPDGSRLVDYKAQNHKYPWIVERNGKRWKWTTASAQARFGRLPGQPMISTATSPPTLDDPLPRTGTGGTYEGQF